MPNRPPSPTPHEPTAPRPGAHPATIPDDALLAQCDLDKGRTGGPGGQHRNKVETKITLTHRPTGIEAHAGERRSPADNTREALFRLRLALAVGVRTSPVARDRWGDVRSDLWISRCDSAGRLSCNPEHRDYPAMLAEALNVVDACGDDVKKAALRLSCSMSQLIKLIKDHPPALAALNTRRADRGLHTLK